MCICNEKVIAMNKKEKIKQSKVLWTKSQNEKNGRCSFSTIRV